MEQDTSTNQTLGVQVTSQQGSTLTRMKKMISSPRARRRNTTQASSNSSCGKIFGASLEDILKRCPASNDVPFIVERICKYIELNGLDQEGIFRVNGNMKIVEKLKNSFDRFGDADLEESGDIMAVAGLLKLFLRELADPIVPEDIHPIFIQAHRDCREEKPFYMKIIQDLIYRIPNPNYALLKYLCNFLVTITKRSDVNKMTPIALAIVFGPNLFRCGEGLEGVRDQAHVNAILKLFIEEYEELFPERGNFFSTPNASDASKPEFQSSLSEGNSPKKQKPARPPPPKFKHSLSAPASSVSLILSPSDDSEYEQLDGLKMKLDPVDENQISSPVEPIRSSSPSVIIPVQSSDGKKMVETTIRDAVKEHLFGPNFLSSSLESDSQISERTMSPDINGDLELSVREKVRRIDANSSIDENSPLTGKARNPSSQKGIKRPKSTPSETSDISRSRIIFQGKEQTAEKIPNLARDQLQESENTKHYKVDGTGEKILHRKEAGKGNWNDQEEDPLKFIQNRSSEPLKSLTANRAPLPRNRRKPTSVRPASIAVSSPSDYGNSQVVYRVPRDKDLSKSVARNSQLFYEGENHRNSSPNIGEFSSSSPYVVINKKGMMARTPRSLTEDSRDESNSPTSSVTTTESMESLRSGLKQSKEQVLSSRLSDDMEPKLHVKVAKQRKSRSVENLLDAPAGGYHERTRSLSPVNDGRTSSKEPHSATSPTTSIYTREVTPLRALSPLTIDTTNVVAAGGKPVSPRKSPRKTAGNLPAGSKHGLLTTVSQDNKTPTPAKREPVERKAHSSIDKLKKHCRDQPVVPPLDLYRLQKEDEIEEAQPSPRARFDRVYNDGPVRSPRSPSVSQMEFDAHYDSPPHPPNHHRNVDWLEKRQESVPTIEMSPKDLKKRIDALKRIIGNFEAAFEEKHGRQPRPTEKTPVQKYVAELGRAKKQLKEMMEELKDFPELLNEVNTPTGEVLSGPIKRDVQVRNSKPSKEETLDGLLKKLQDKRWAAARPEEIEVMSHDQLTEEKLSVQKSLLQYESLHGRPSTKEDKALMRPLYERYRKIKRLIATETIKMLGPATPEKSERKFSDSRDRNSKDLEPILEGVQLQDFHENESHTGSLTERVEGVKPLQNLNDDRLNDTFAVTTRLPEHQLTIGTNSGSNGSLDEAVLHEASLEELLEQQKLAKKQKKKLGKTLKIFEDNFIADNGRKVQKEDRLPMETEYRDYKVIKARLRLLEALISKLDANQTV